LQKIGSALASAETAEERAIRRKRNEELKAMNKVIGPPPKSIDVVKFYMSHAWPTLRELYHDEHGCYPPGIKARSEYCKYFWDHRESAESRAVYTQMCNEYNEKAQQDHKQLVDISQCGLLGMSMPPAEREKYVPHSRIADCSL
jgi:hypothetical protein